MKRLHDSVEMDLAYAERVSDEIYRHQPFILSLLLGYKDDMTLEELDELVAIFFLIWERFKDKRNIKSVRLTEETYEAAHGRNIVFFEWYGATTGDKARHILYTKDLEGLKSKELWTQVVALFHTRPLLAGMDIDARATILIGIKSLIEALEDISAR